MKISIFTVGKLRGAAAEMAAEYEKRMVPPVTVRAFSASFQKAADTALLKAIPPKAFVVLLDEKGRDLSSAELAQKIGAWRDNGVSELIFLIGGADGHGESVRARADFVLGLGKKTWPHRLAHVMLIEQLYRSQQILAGHPYHRE